MATSPLGGFADLSVYRAAAAQPQGNTLDNIIREIVQSQQIKQLPGQMQQLPGQLQDQALQRQLQNAILSQKLQDLQNPEAAVQRQLLQDFQKQLVGASFDPLSGIRRAGVGAPPVGEIEPVINPITGEETPFVRDLEMRRSNLAKSQGQAKPFEVGGSLVQLNPTTGKYEAVFTAPTKPEKSPFTQQTVVSLTDSSDVRQAIPDENGRPPEGYQFIKATDHPMKPSEVISSQREIRSTYDEMPSKLDLFGKGQVPGSYQLKTRLDSVLNPVKGDFSKLNPQAKQTFVFAINKLRDPTSATLLAEASQIAARAGIGDRFNAFFQNWKEGDPLPDQVAKDIYQVISQVYDAHKEAYLEDIVPTVNSLKTINKDLTDIGVPVKFANEIKGRISAPAPTEPVVSPVGTPGINPNAPAPIKIGRFELIQ